MYNAELGVGCNSAQSNCQNSNGCSGTPDLCIKRHDGKPHFKVSVSDCPRQAATALWFSNVRRSSAWL